MRRLRSAAVITALLASTGCAFTDEDSPSDDGVESEETATLSQKLAADDLYSLLRQLEYALPPTPAEQTIPMGSWVPGGTFQGLASTCSIQARPKVKICTPPTATINAVRGILRFQVPQGVTLTANGRSATSGWNNVVELDVGNADQVSWTLRSGGYSVSDSLSIARPDVGGMGAFTISALPVTIVYEPPQNQARSNTASAGFANERTVVDSITSGNSTTEAPKWAEGQVAKALGAKLASWAFGKAVGAADPDDKSKLQAVGNLFKSVEQIWGTVDTSVSHATEVNTDKTLSVKVARSENITTTSRLGPGAGDLIVFYKDARVAWGMDQGRVSLTMIDHGPLAIMSVATLKADLAALGRGEAATSGLDADTLKSLIALDPMASTGVKQLPGSILSGPTLPTARFPKDQSLLINGANYNLSVSHAISQSDKVSKLSSTTTVKDYHPGWLTLVGVGQTEAGKVTTKVSYGSSRTVTNTQTKSASISLSAGAGESYGVDIHYDNIFGTFLVRTPPPPPVLPPILSPIVSR